ncbi:MAG: helix-turn-helix domain-containing protein [Leptolyngbyaceae cyanobacterium bins.349]|nr:helix-turn-helix domain-containing protein [Leptolyngbyaceae cyanobacterium bins.349]
MLSVSSRFIQIARNVTDKVSALLNAPVLVIDRRGVIITRSDHISQNLYSKWEDSTTNLSDFLRLPIRYQAETGEIVVGKPLDQNAVSPRIAQALVELVIDQTANHQSQTASFQELKDQFINDLLHGRIQDELVAIKYAHQFEIDLTPPRAVILINASAYINSGDTANCELAAAERQRKTQAIIRSIVNFFHLPNDTICAGLGQGEICVLKASDTKNLGSWAESEQDAKGLSSSWANLAALKRAADALLIRLRNETATAIDIGIGRYHPGISGLARSYEDARAALSLGSRFQGHNRVHCLGELGVAAFVGVADESTKIDLAKYLLSPMDHERELFTTLDVFFSENCCPSSTAKRLSIHRNTLSYRLDKIFSLTGLEPRKFDDAVQMRLCLLLRSLQSPIQAA